MEHNHDQLVTKVRSELPPDNLLADLTSLYKSFSDKTRIKILFSLLNTELCVCAISELLGMEQSAISHQLRALKSAATRLLPVFPYLWGKKIAAWLSDIFCRTHI